MNMMSRGKSFHSMARNGISDNDPQETRARVCTSAPDKGIALRFHSLASLVSRTNFGRVKTGNVCERLKRLTIEYSIKPLFDKAFGNGAIGEHWFTNLVQRTLSVSNGSCRF